MEIIWDNRQHYIGERELVDWMRPDGWHRNIPVMYLRAVTAEDYLATKPHIREELERCPNPQFFWEVSVD